MAYMSQERKKELAPKIKEILNKYGLKGSLSVRNHSALVLTIKSGKIDFIGDQIAHYRKKIETGSYSFSAERFEDQIKYLTEKKNFDVNEYHINEEYYGKNASILSEIKDAMMVGNHDNSDVMTDYFDVGWYIDISVGRWDKPYVFEG